MLCFSCEGTLMQKPAALCKPKQNIVAAILNSDDLICTNYNAGECMHFYGSTLY